MNSNIHWALGCVGTVVDGAIRDVDEMKNSGFKALAQRLCVGHAFSHPVRWSCEVEVFGRRVSPGDLIHADKHGFMVIPENEQERLLEASLFMDENECETLIPVARSATGKPTEAILQSIDEAGADFGKNVQDRFGKDGEF